MAASSPIFNTILVPLDGSRLAERALPHAANVGRAVGGRLLLARSAEHTGSPTVGLDAMKQLDLYLAGLAEPLRRTGIDVSTRVDAGDPVAGLLDLQRGMQADLVVMATLGRSGAQRWLHGSVTEGVLAGSATPVLLIRVLPTEPAVRTDSAAPNLLVPLDGSEFAESILPTVQALATAAHGSLTLIQVVPMPSACTMGLVATTGAYPPAEPETDESQALEYLQQVRARLLAADPTSHIHLEVRVGEPASQISAAVGDRYALLIALASQALTGVGRLLLGSTTDSLLRSADAPLLGGPAGRRPRQAEQRH